MRARCCYTLQPYERWRNAHNKCNCNQFGYALSFLHPCTVIHAGVALSLCRASSGEFSKMCDTMHGREWETPLTQNFRSYLAFYYYDCFYGWFCCAVRALLILLSASRKRYYFTSFYDHHASCVPFLFAVLRNMLNRPPPPPQTLDSVIYSKWESIVLNVQPVATVCTAAH